MFTNRLSRLAFTPKTMQFNLVKSNFTQVRRYSLIDAINNVDPVLDMFKKLAYIGGTGVGAYAALRGVDTYKKNSKIKEEAFSAAKVLGLKSVKDFSGRSIAHQTEAFNKAKSKILIIGINGDRLFNDTVQNSKNTVPETLEKLMKDGVEINIIMPKGTKLSPKAAEWTKLFGKETGSFKFKIKIAKDPLSFHGDLIDGVEIHYLPVPPSGFDPEFNPRFEIYDAQVENGKYLLLKMNFESVWNNIE